MKAELKGSFHSALNLFSLSTSPFSTDFYFLNTEQTSICLFVFRQLVIFLRYYGKIKVYDKNVNPYLKGSGRGITLCRKMKC